LTTGVKECIITPKHGDLREITGIYGKNPHCVCIATLAIYAVFTKKADRTRMPDISYELSGRFDNKLDASNRVTLPATLKEQLGKDIVITMGVGNHARIYPKPVWLKMKAMLSQKSPIEALEKSRPLIQRLNNGSETLSADKDGRILLSYGIREWIRTKEAMYVIFIGNDDHVELWSSKEWEEYTQNYEYNAIEEAYIVLSERIKGIDSSEIQTTSQSAQ